MALVKCPDCGRDVSDAAPACPACGRPGDRPQLQPQTMGQQQPIVTKPHWTQDRNLGCLGACLIFLVLPVVLMMTMCHH